MCGYMFSYLPHVWEHRLDRGSATAASAVVRVHATDNLTEALMHSWAHAGMPPPLPLTQAAEAQAAQVGRVLWDTTPYGMPTVLPLN